MHSNFLALSGGYPDGSITILCLKTLDLGSSAWNVNLHVRACAEAAGVVEASAVIAALGSGVPLNLLCNLRGITAFSLPVRQDLNPPYKLKKKTNLTKQTKTNQTLALHIFLLA